MRRILFPVFILILGLTGCRTAGGGAAAPFLFGGSTASTPTPLITEKLASNTAELVGTWQGLFQGNPAYLIFNADGSLTVSGAPDGSSGMRGQFFFEGTLMRIRTDLPFRHCGVNDTGSYEVHLHQEAGVTTSLVFVEQGDECKERLQSLVQETSAWVRQ